MKKTLKFLKKEMESGNSELVTREEGKFQLVLTLDPEKQSVNLRPIFAAQIPYGMLLSALQILRDQMVAQAAVQASQSPTTPTP